MDNFKGKSLTIISDCSYSGKWINECAKKLDEVGIPSCGHHTRKKGMLLKIVASCGSTEEATVLSYIKEGVYYDEEDKGVIYCPGKPLASGQTPMCVDFRDICCSNHSESCEVDSSCTWEDRLANKCHLIRFICGRVDRPVWYCVLVDENYELNTNIGAVNIAKYGKVLHSEWGENPPKDVLQQKVNLHFSRFV